MRKLYIVPGYAETTRSKNYSDIKKVAKSLGFEIVHVNIGWDTEKTMDDYLSEAELKLRSVSVDDVVLGFSFGAYIIAILAVNLKCKFLVLCSVSPYFKEDLKFIPNESKDYFGKAFMNSLLNKKIANNISPKSWILIGQDDWDLALKRAQSIHLKWKNSELIHVKKAGHVLSNPNYLKSITKVLKTIKKL